MRRLEKKGRGKYLNSQVPQIADEKTKPPSGTATEDLPPPGLNDAGSGLEQPEGFALRSFFLRTSHKLTTFRFCPLFWKKRACAMGHGKRNRSMTNPNRSVCIFSFSTFLVVSPCRALVFMNLNIHSAPSEASAPTDICKLGVSTGAHLQKPGPQHH